MNTTVKTLAAMGTVFFLMAAAVSGCAGEPEAGAAPLAPVMMDALAWGQRLDEAMGFSPYEPEDPLI